MVVDVDPSNSIDADPEPTHPVVGHPLGNLERPGLLPWGPKSDENHSWQMP